MGVSRGSGAKNGSRKRKRESGNKDGELKAPRRKVMKEEPEEMPCTVEPSVVKGKKKKSLEMKVKPLQENIISSSLTQEAEEGEGLGLSLQDGIQAEEGAASGLETDSTLHQGPSVGPEDSSRSQCKPGRAGPAAGQQLLETKARVGVPKPSDGVAGEAPSLSEEPLEMDVGLTAMTGEEKELDLPVLQQQEDAQGLTRKEKQERRKQKEKGLLGERGRKDKVEERKRGRKEDKLDKSLGNVMESIKEESADGDSSKTRRRGRAKQGSSKNTRKQGGMKKKQKGQEGKRKEVKKVRKMGKKTIKKEKLEEEQELEKANEEEGENGVGDELEEKDGVGKGSENREGVKEEDEKGDEGWGETQSAGIKEEVKDEEGEEGKGDVPRKRKVKKAEKEMEEKGEKSEEEETPRKKPKRESKEEGGGKRNKKAKKKKEEEKEATENKWKWWEEEKKEDGIKWIQLEHRGPYFAPLYEPLPEDVQFYYNGKPLKLSLATEEIATFYAKMLDHEYTTKEIFQTNFFNDWRKEMTSAEQKIIKDLDKCDFSEIHKYFVDKNEARKALPKEEKQKLKEEADKIQEEYGYCILDGHREKIGNFKTEPPGLFRGRGDHPKMGMLKKRIMPEDVVINCSKDSKIPEPPQGHKWKEVRCDNTVTWLASWTENIQHTLKYIMLNPSSKLKGQKDWQKYELARRLKDVVHKIRAQYQIDWKSKEMKERQRAVALYFIDKLALRAGNEKEEGETADTVGCCSLRVEHIRLHPELDGQKHVVEFDFLGKDSIRYYNKVSVEKPVFKNLKLFMKNKSPADELFDRLKTSILNKHLQNLMDGLTAKVFRTYNASITLQEQLKALTNSEDSVAAKLLAYNRANRAVAILCNHQRSTPKTYEKSMQILQTKIDAKKQQVEEAQEELKKAEDEFNDTKDPKAEANVEKKKKKLKQLEEQLAKLNVQATDKEENKQIALGTSKLNYLDPRISIAW
ncbi:DNA topoisomerase I, mitochondrial isoform X1 [Pezoporus wallicus]|uniref:DNA topoisomerase I, mitochondrial isoform X1 n=1 Tax=Pezoporus wallicus TaxID=35540 RepID=UPI00254B18C3|nr:DNA topoisomerase I, mitochondrial isoform X1 [Pezoporus wallicus]